MFRLMFIPMYNNIKIIHMYKHMSIHMSLRRFIHMYNSITSIPVYIVNTCMTSISVPKIDAF